MAIFPFVSVTADNITTSLPIFKEIAWNYETDSPIMQDGEPVIVEKTEAIKVWIYKAMNTERYLYMAHTWKYGAEVESLIGTTLTPKAKESEIKRYITETLLVNPYITEIKDFSISFKSDTVNAEFTVITIYGEVSMSV